MRVSIFGAAALSLCACGPTDLDDPVDAGVPDAGAPDAGEAHWDPALFATSVVSFTPGANAGFGQAKLPDVVLGAPRGEGEGSGSFDVVSLGNKGEIVLGFDRDILDGEGADFIVFENEFSGFVEEGIVAASLDGADWHAFPCAEDHAGCAGVHAVLSNPKNGIDPTDPAKAGGDAFDLAAISLDRARFVRIQDSGRNTYAGNAGGFDLDAVSIVHGEARP